MFLDNGQRRREDLEQPCSQFATESMAAPFSAFTSSEIILLDSNSLSYNQQGILGNPNVWWYHPSMITTTSLRPQYQLKAQFLLRSIDLFRINAATLLNLKHLVLPPQFPPHIDSIRADLLSQQMSSSDLNPIATLEYFREETISAYGRNLKEVPAMFSYATAGHHLIPTQFGVSAPRSRCDTTLTAATEVRDYRRRQCWGEFRKPPVEQELWKHGNCAEYQSLPSVVAWCERLGLENVSIETLAMKKSGEFVGMCKNCIDYVLNRILRKHPTWKVYDVYTTKAFQVTWSTPRVVFIPCLPFLLFCSWIYKTSGLPPNKMSE